MTTVDRAAVQYQQVLRSLGAYLDHEGAEQISILETSAGFALRYQRAGAEEMVLRKFRMAELPVTRGASAGAWGHGRASSYEDFLRALGHELEEEGAWSILLDELENSYLLSYHYLDPRTMYHPIKRRLHLGPDEQGMIVEYAHSRRSGSVGERGGLFGWLFG